MEWLDFVGTEGEIELECQESTSENNSEMAQAVASISDLPDGILEPILRSACADANSRAKKLSTLQVHRLSSVCARWRDVLLSTCQRALCSFSKDADGALRELRSLKNVTHVSIDRASENEASGVLLRGLALGFPLLTSFTFALRGDHRALDKLSSFLSLRTNIQVLGLLFDTTRAFQNEGSCLRYRKALEDLDFASQARLRKLTLDCCQLSAGPLGALDGGRYFPVSPTLAQVASLEELRISVHFLDAPLPPWLAELPAFFGLKIWDHSDAPPPVVASLRSMTGLRELALQCLEVGPKEMDLISRMRQLTTLELRWDISLTPGDSAPNDSSLLSWSASRTLQKLKLCGDVMPRNATPLPLLEDLTLEASTAIQPNYFAFTPSVRRLEMVLYEGTAWPNLACLSQLTSLSLSVSQYSRNDAEGDELDSSEGEGTEGPRWHICRAHTHTLQTLELCSCKLLPLVDGLLALERHVAVSLLCTCHSHYGHWFDCHAEYQHAAAQERPCHLLPPGDARQLFKDTRRPAPGPPAPGPCNACPSPTRDKDRE
eukprot:jgi/Mesen1/7250/ME000373S06321